MGPSYNFNKTHLICDSGAYTKEDECEIVNEESTKEYEQLLKDLIHPVAACQPNVDIEMCITEEVLKEGNNELPQAKDHQVLDNISHNSYLTMKFMKFKNFLPISYMQMM